MNLQGIDFYINNQYYPNEKTRLKNFNIIIDLLKRTSPSRDKNDTDAMIAVVAKKFFIYGKSVMF